MTAPMPSPVLAFNREGDRYFQRGQYTDALACYLKALEFGRRGGNDWELAVTLGNLANVLACTGRTEEARAHYREVLSLQRDLQDRPGLAATLVNLGNLEADAGRLDRAEAYYLEALDLLPEAASDDLVAVLMSNLGLVRREKGDWEGAFRRFEEALERARHGQDQAIMAQVYNHLARTYLMTKRYEEGLSCALSALAIYQRLDEELGVAASRYHLAFLCRALGREEAAIRCLEQVVAIDEKYGLPKLSENRRILETWRRSGRREANRAGQ